MKKISYCLLGALLLPAMASAQAARSGEDASPGLNVGLVSSALADDPIPGAREILAFASFDNLDFRLDRTRRGNASARAVHVAREHPQRAAADTADVRLGPAPALEAAPSMGSLSPYVAVSYRGFGEVSDLQLAGAMTRSVGVAMTVENTVLLLSYDRSDAPLAGIDPEDLFAAASNRLTEDVALTFFGTRGLSYGSADMMVGTALTFSFIR